MIKNARELKHTKGQIERFRAVLAQLDAQNRPADVDPKIYDAYCAGLASQLGSMEHEVSEFEQLRAGSVDWSDLRRAGAQPETLIRARIARRLSEKQLAERVGVTAQQIREWEDNDYDDVEADQRAAIARALEVEVPLRPFFTIEAPRIPMIALLAIAQRLGAEASATFSPSRFAGALHEPATGAVGADLVLTLLAFASVTKAVSFLRNVAGWVNENQETVLVKGLDGDTLLTLRPGVRHTDEEFADVVAALEASEGPR